MREIPLTQGKVALVDDSDYDRLAAFRWFARRHRNTWYATRNQQRADGFRRPVDMHVVLMGDDAEGREVDHLDGNGLNNQRGNLRWATPAEQRQNTQRHRDNRSGFKGVSFDKERRKYLAQLTKDYRRVLYARFDTAEEAARAYDAKAREMFGKFARLNFPTSVSPSGGAGPVRLH